MYAELLGRLADDLEAGGVTCTVLAGHEDDPGPSGLGLRLLGSVHRLVLERRASGLRSSTRASAAPGSGWWLARLRGAARAGARRGPRVAGPAAADQRGRPGRRAGRWPAPARRDVPAARPAAGDRVERRAQPARRPVRLRDGRRGGPGACRQPAAAGRPRRGTPLEPWPDLQVAERLGSDPMPVDVGTTEGRLVLTAYVWPDQHERHERLRQAFAVAAAHPVEVRRLDGLRPGRRARGGRHHRALAQRGAHRRAGAGRGHRDAGQAGRGRDGVGAVRAPVRRAHPSYSRADHEFLVVLRAWPRRPPDPGHHGRPRAAHDLE